MPEQLHSLQYRHLIEAALREDLGDAGDITSAALLPAGLMAVANLVARAPGRLAGVNVACEVFAAVDGATVTEIVRQDGADVAPGDVIATVKGLACSLLAAERVALNFLGHLSGIATATRAAVQAAAAHGAKIADTRKTTPGLRILEKYAVRVGGGVNHRFGLYDAVLIKDNHVAVAGGVAEAVRRARAVAGHMVRIEVEVDTLAQLAEALAAGADAVLLDNMTLDELRQAVEMTRLVVSGTDKFRPRRIPTLEASGGIGLDDIAAVAATGVDLISLGRLTHSAPALDVAMEMD